MKLEKVVKNYIYWFIGANNVKQEILELMAESYKSL